MGDLAKKQCNTCAPLKGKSLKTYLDQLGKDWKVDHEHHLEKEYIFKNFKQALDFTNEVGSLAEKLGHHPDILLQWGKVNITLYTHKINGLTDNDFILARQCDAVFEAKFQKKIA